MAQIKNWPVENGESACEKNPTFQKPVKASSTRTILEELFKLLEDYAPVWYTVDHHNRAAAALSRKES